MLNMMFPLSCFTVELVSSGQSSSFSATPSLLVGELVVPYYFLFLFLFFLSICHVFLIDIFPLVFIMQFVQICSPVNSEAFQELVYLRCTLCDTLHVHRWSHLANNELFLLLLLQIVDLKSQLSPFHFQVQKLHKVASSIGLNTYIRHSTKNELRNVHR